MAVAVAMIFCMISFKGAVFDYIYETETSAAGNSDIVISTNSNSDRITTVAEPLKNIEEVKDIVPSLNLYALYKNEYVSVRAFVSSQLQTLQKSTLPTAICREWKAAQTKIISSCQKRRRNISD